MEKLDELYFLEAQEEKERFYEELVFDEAWQEATAIERAAWDKAVAEKLMNPGLHPDDDDWGVNVRAQGIIRLAKELNNSGKKISAPAESPYRIIDKGEYYSITFEDITKLFKKTKGLRCIKYLIENKGHDKSLEEIDKDVFNTEQAEVKQENQAFQEFGDNYSTIDPAAINRITPDEKSMEQYKDVITDLHKDLEDAKANNDIGRAEKIQKEINFYTKEFQSKKHNLKKDDKRRPKVTNAIRRDRDKIIRKELPSLAVHLDKFIHTGSYCTYTPNPDIDWKFF